MYREYPSIFRTRNLESQPWAQPRWIQLSRNLGYCWVSHAGAKNVLADFGCKALLWISLTYSWIQRPAKDSTSKPHSAPREGRGSPLPKEGTGTTRYCKECAGFGHGQCFPCLSQFLSIFKIWGNFLLGLLPIYYGEFLLFKFFKKEKLKIVLFFSRHLWVLTQYIIYW